MDKGVEVQLLVSQKEVDSRLVRKYPEIRYWKVAGAPFSMKPAAFLRFLSRNTLSFIQGLRYLRKNPPAVILAFGGFLSGSYMLAGWLLKVPLVLHEANRVPGKSVRFLSGIADMVFLPDGVNLAGIEPRRIRRLGMPLRREVTHIPKDVIRRKMGIPLPAKLLVVVGGSQGATVLNDWVKRNYKSLAADGIWVFLVSGPGKQELPEKISLMSEQGKEVEVRSYAFHGAMHELFCCADVVLSRAGAGTIAELVGCLTPSILVPYPHAADDHQVANARNLERRGGCVMILQSEIITVYREVLDLIYNDWLLGQMRDNLRRLTYGDAAVELAGFIRKHYLNDSGGRDRAPDPSVPVETSPHV